MWIPWVKVATSDQPSEEHLLINSSEDLEEPDRPHSPEPGCSRTGRPAAQAALSAFSLLTQARGLCVRTVEREDDKSESR